MNKLIILIGDSGCGKTHLAKLLNNNCKEDVVVIRKCSDREMRPGEENAIEIKSGCSTEEVKAMEYTYIGKNNKVYGFSKKKIDGALAQGKSPIVIIGNEEMLIQLCKDYEDRICPIYMERDVSDLDFIEELRKDNRTEKQIRERIESRHEYQALWRRRPNLFGYRYIINAQFMDNEKLLGWFGLIAQENDVDIKNISTINNARPIVNYFRTLWKGRPAILNSDKGSKPVIDEE